MKVARGVYLAAHEPAANQLQSIVLRGDKAYLPNIAASPESPLQFQKQLCLQEARQLMLNQSLDLAGLDAVDLLHLAGPDAVVDSVAARCTEVESGARNVDNILTNTLLPEVSKLLLEQMVAGNKPSRLEIRIGDDGTLVYQTDSAAEPAAVAS